VLDKGSITQKVYEEDCVGRLKQLVQGATSVEAAEAVLQDTSKLGLITVSAAAAALPHGHVLW
jgi:hypothetical protein